MPLTCFDRGLRDRGNPVFRVSIDGPGSKDFGNLAPSGISDPIQFDCSNTGKTENFMLVAVGSDGKQVTKGVTVTNTGVVPDPQPDPEPTEESAG